MSERGKSGIYAIRCRPTGKVYIGQAASIGDRWLTHRSHLNCGRHANRHLQSAWAKHGEAAFEFIVLAYVEADKDALARAEQWWVDRFEPEFNIAPVAGSSLGTRHPPRSEEFRKRMGDLKRGFKHAPKTIAPQKAIAARKRADGTIYRQTPEHREKLRAIGTAHLRTEQAQEKRRQAALGRVQSPDEIAKRAAALRGKKRTPEQCARIAAAKKGHGVGVKQSPELIERRVAALRGKPRPQHVIDAMVAGRRRWLEMKRGT